MDKHYLVAVITVGILGVSGVIGGCLIICILKDSQSALTAGMACIGIGATVAGGVIGALVTPRSTPAPSPNVNDVADLAALQVAVSQAANTIKKGV